MKSKLLKVCLAALLSISVAACDDDSDSSKKDTSNQPSAGGNTVDPGNGSTDEGTNDPGNTETGVCTVGDVVCEGGSLYACGTDRQWAVSMKCANGCDASKKACAQGSTGGNETGGNTGGNETGGNTGGNETGGNTGGNETGGNTSAENAICTAKGYDTCAQYDGDCDTYLGTNGNIACCDGEEVYCYNKNGSTGGNTGSSDYYECNNATCEMSDGSSVACGSACKSAYGSNYSAWCSDADSSVTCSTSQPGSGSTGGNTSSNDYYECNSETCQMSDGSSVACGSACKSAYGSNYSAWCSADDNNVTCSASQPGSGSTGGNTGSSDYYQCNSETCQMSDGSSMACGNACKSAYGSNYSAWCSDSEDSVKCSVSQPSGSGSTGGNTGSSDYYQCNSETCQMSDGSSMACGNACKSAYGSNYSAWCSDSEDMVTCSVSQP